MTEPFMKEPTAIYYHRLAKQYSDGLVTLNKRIDQVMQMDAGGSDEAKMLRRIKNTLRPSNLDTRS
jgi:hypothetical protein